MIRIALAAVALSLGVPSAAAPPAPQTKPVAAPAPAPEVHVHDHAGHAHVHAAPAPVVVVDDVKAVRPATARPVADPGARFRTVEAAMRYLAAAYNRRDLTSLKHVTTPDARKELEAMRAIATDLRLESCTWTEGYYSCTFSHAYPKAKGRGDAWFNVAPARKPGWYMTVMEGCG